jgi:hypothetical protein
MKVIVNRQRNVALLATQGPRWVHLIRITAHGLESERITEEQLCADWSELASYPVEHAVRRFTDISQTVGTSASAKHLLEKHHDISIPS